MTWESDTIICISVTCFLLILPFSPLYHFKHVARKIMRAFSLSNGETTLCVQVLYLSFKKHEQIFSMTDVEGGRILCKIIVRC